LFGTCVQLDFFSFFADNEITRFVLAGPKGLAFRLTIFLYSTFLNLRKKGQARPCFSPTRFVLGVGANKRPCALEKTKAG